MRLLLLFLVFLSGLFLPNIACGQQAPIKKVAALCFVYTPLSHADVLITKFLAGFPIDDGVMAPKTQIVSLYIQQRPVNDIGIRLAEHYNIPVFDNVHDALTLGRKTLAVDAVLFIGEHGNFPRNKYGAIMYPRMPVVADIFQVFESSNRVVPLYIDKHLAYNWLDARWIYDRARELNVPLMAGSSIPLVWRDPPLEHPAGSKISEAVFLTFADPDAYGMHAMEAISEMIERRPGGETGIASVQCLRGAAVYAAAKAGRFSMDLVDAAAATLETKKAGTMEELEKDPTVMIVDYVDGTKATVVWAYGYFGMGWAYAARVEGKIVATEYLAPNLPAKPIFSYLGLNIEQFFLTGKAPYPVERTLLATGAVDACLRSAYAGGTIIETPQLRFSYPSPQQAPIRPSEPRPIGASIAPWPPEELKYIYK